MAGAEETRRAETAQTTADRVRRNFYQSFLIVFLAFFLNAAINIVLIGWLTRIGGFELVGLWSLMNTVVLIVILADLGNTNALTRHVAVHGVADSVPFIMMLSVLLAVSALVVTPLAVLGALFAGLETSIVIGGVLSGAGGLLQVLSGWAIALRLGLHQQYWFNIKTIVRVVSQSALAAGLLLFTPLEPVMAFGAALLAGGVLELVFAVAVLYPLSAAMRAGAAAPWPSLRSARDLARGFGMANVLQRLQEPVWRSIVGGLAGAAALGVFTVAWRLPLVLSASVSEGLRVLLPGLSQLQKESEAAAIHAILRDSVLVQILTCLPAAMFIAVFIEDVMTLWLGSTTPELLGTTRLLLASLVPTSLAVPYYWALQALGDASYVARATAISLAWVTIAGAGALMATGGGLLCFAGVILSAQIGFVVLTLWRSHRRWGILVPSIGSLSAVGCGLLIATLAVFMVLLNGQLAPEASSLSRLTIASISVGIVYAIVVGLSFKMRWLFK
ncbi:MAG: hypothetical protein MI723_11265 [Caulobacterales bacterium]|nr:hypothetical protein [Caulobacterales bacterium]